MLKNNGRKLREKAGEEEKGGGVEGRVWEK